MGREDLLRQTMRGLQEERRIAEEEIRRIDKAIGALQGLIETEAPTDTPSLSADDSLARRAMSPAARKAVSVRMKAYWSQRRAEGGRKKGRTGGAKKNKA